MRAGAARADVVRGFDIIYALQDADYDRAHGLHSIPQRFSLRTALAISVALHAVSVGALLWFGSYCPQGALLWTGEALFVAILAAEHLLVTPSRQRNIGSAFGHAQRVGESHAGALRDRPIDCRLVNLNRFGLC